VTGDRYGAFRPRRDAKGGLYLEPIDPEGKPMAELMRLPPPTRRQVLAELERELAMRATVFPSLVYQKKLRQFDADHRNACLRRALADLAEYYGGQADGR